MFDQYCAVCHGTDATGNGSTDAAALKTPLVDLTKLRARNGGTFPEVRVQRYIQGRDETDSPHARDGREMPEWKKLFESLDRDAALLRVRNLVTCLETHANSRLTSRMRAS